MPFPAFKAPDPDTLIAAHPTIDAKLYAELGDCPLYVNARLIAPGLLGDGRKSFHLGWVIKDARWAKGKDVRKLPPEVLEWAAPLIKDVYPDLETATGMNAEEIAEIESEQAVKRAEFNKKREGE